MQTENKGRNYHSKQDLISNSMLENKYRQSNNIKHIDRKNKTNKPKASSGNSFCFYYSFLTFVLLLCLIQVSISTVLNISKIVSYKAKIIQITKTKNEAFARNEQLKDSIKNFSNVAGLEEIARNNLKMSGEDEVLVIINTPKQEENTEKKHFWSNIFNKPQQ